MYLLQEEDRRPLLVPQLVIASSGKHYLPFSSTEEATLENIVWLEIESDNWLSVVGT